MLARLGRLCVRRRRVVMLASLFAFLIAGGVGGGVAEHLSSGGFEDPDASSTIARELMDETFDNGDPNLILLLTVPDGSVDDRAVVRVAGELEAELAEHPRIDRVLSYWNLGRVPPFRSADGDQALILARVDGTEDEIDDAAAEIRSALAGTTRGPVEIGVGGFAAVFDEIGRTIEADLARAEAVAIPITLILLVLVFGGLVAASLPLAIGILAIIGTFFVLRVISEITQVSIFALNMTTAMGLGLAIDYSLFVVSRFREELHHGLDVPDAVVRTVDTAGRTVAFSALTVAASMSALLLFPFAFLRSFAYAGIPVVGLAAIGSIVTLPAILAALGHNIDRWAIWKREPRDPGEGGWHRIAVAVMKRPLPIATVVIAVLLLLGAPALRMELDLPDDRVQSTSADTRQVHDQIRAGFQTNEAFQASVVVPDVGSVEENRAEFAALAAAISEIPAVGRVDSHTGSYIGGQQILPPGPLAPTFVSPDRDAAWMRAVPVVEPISEEGQQMIRDIRAIESPFDEIWVGGASAQLLDSTESLLAQVPLAAGLIGLITFVVLFGMFGSLVVPAKAIVLNLLSLTATFGAMVWIFQDGNGSGVLDFTPTGALAITTPILMFCIAFGLSMDYEVFLLSRIKEEYDRTGDNEASVAAGLERTGRIVTAAAALISVVFLAMVSSSISFVKLFGLGLALAVIVDATLVRATLVPAFMRLAGSANWWAPAPLRRLHDRFGFSESSESLAVYATDGDAPSPVTVEGDEAADLADSPVEAPAEPAPAPARSDEPAPSAAKPAARKRRQPLVAPGRPGRPIRLDPEDRPTSTKR